MRNRSETGRRDVCRADFPGESMNIYFAGSIRGGREDVSIYSALILHLREFGEVLTEHVGSIAVSEIGNDGPDDRIIHDRDVAWLAKCDLVVAEVSTPSLGVGYELGLATVSKKPVLCLYRTTPGRPLSAMIAGSPCIRAIPYTSLDQAKSIIKEFITKTIPDKRTQ